MKNIKLTTKGYINLIGRNKVETNKKGTPKIYRSKKLLFLAKKVQEYRSTMKSQFNKALVKAGILESGLNIAKTIVKGCKGMYLTSSERFNVMLGVWKAQKNLREFKASLRPQFKALLF
jgi:hypothetical protein